MREAGKVPLHVHLSLALATACRFQGDYDKLRRVHKAKPNLAVSKPPTDDHVPLAAGEQASVVFGEEGLFRGVHAAQKKEA